MNMRDKLSFRLMKYVSLLIPSFTEPLTPNKFESQRYPSGIVPEATCMAPRSTCEGVKAGNELRFSAACKYALLKDQPASQLWPNLI